MPVFEYKAYNTAGKLVSGVIDADNPSAARLKLRKTGVYTTTLKEAEQAKDRRKGLRTPITIIKRVKLADLAIMTRQLSTLLGAGLPLVESLTALIDQTSNYTLKKVLSQVRERVNEGSTLADALGEHPKIFSSLYVNMTRAGESSGALEIVLMRLADFTEGQLALKNKLFATLAYPILMLFVGSGVLLFLLTFVIPKVTSIFYETQQALPLPTQILITSSSLLKDTWWLILAGLVFLIVGLRKVNKNERGKAFFDGLKLNLPFFGKLIQKIAIARFTRTFGILLHSGIPVLTSLDIVKTVVNNSVLFKAIEEARNNIREGEAIAPPLNRSGLFPPMVTHMISVGERSGRLEEMLQKISEASENEVQATIQGLTSLLEPVMILFMGSIVGFIVLSILLPIFEMNQLVR